MLGTDHSICLIQSVHIFRYVSVSWINIHIMYVRLSQMQLASSKSYSPLVLQLKVTVTM